MKKDSNNEKLLNYISVVNARVHNLKNLSINIPKNKLVIFTGVSGSGKSSLAFDTIYSEGQRRYVNSLNSYARQFLGVANKPDVDDITGLTPAISIDQKTSNYNPRSTVGTITEIYDYLRVMFARTGLPHCLNGHGAIKSKTIKKITNEICTRLLKKSVTILSLIVKNKKGSHINILNKLRSEGFIRCLVDGVIYNLNDEISLQPKNFHTIYIIVDHFVIEEDNDSLLRLTEACEAASKYSNGLITIKENENNDILTFSERYSCTECNFSIKTLEPRLFSFNSPIGSCEKCQGLGVIFGVNKELLFNWEKTILDGGIEFLKNIVNTSNLLWQEQVQLFDYYKIPTNIPLKNLSKKQINIIMYGSNDRIKYLLFNETSGNKYEKYSCIEGIAIRIERLHNETTSESALNYYKSYMSEATCNSCYGSRLNKEALSVLIDNKNIYDLCKMPINELLILLLNLNFDEFEMHILKNLIDEIVNRVKFLDEVGLGYLSLSRRSNTLSGGEFQRIRLATQIGSKLTGVLYVLDEPSIGLHQKDNHKLIATLKSIRDQGNSVIVVEHDEETMLSSDYIIDIGPGAGQHGGKVVSHGIPSEFCKENSITAQYLLGTKQIKIVRKPKKGIKFIEVKGARENNLKNINVKFPLNLITCVTGVSGSGKSTLVNSILYNGLKRLLGEKSPYVGKHSKIIGSDNIDKVINISQKPIGRTSRSNPATYVGLFNKIRELYSSTIEAKARGYTPGRFSFNVPGGRCQKCQGSGIIRVSMIFMEDSLVECEECHSKRYNKQTLEIFFKGKNIYDILDTTVEEALIFFEKQPQIVKYLKVLNKVGLGYIKLGQPAPQLSGGEAQRIKLALHLSKKSTGKTLFILDEPTTGLHFTDIQKLINVLHEMIDRKDTIIIIEHNLDIIKIADYIIDLGPDGGVNGGKVVDTGTPHQLVKRCKGYTGEYLAKKVKL